MPNTELLKKTLAYVETHPDEWVQSVWLENRNCGTVGCFAGWAVVLGGGDRENVHSEAVRLLELPDSAQAMFAGSQTLEGLRTWVKLLTEEGPAYLARADLVGAYLVGADLAGADLVGADLVSADLVGADLAGAYLAGADLARADLARAKGNELTKLPDGCAIEDGQVVRRAS